MEITPLMQQTMAAMTFEQLRRETVEDLEPSEKRTLDQWRVYNKTPEGQVHKQKRQLANECFYTNALAAMILMDEMVKTEEGRSRAYQARLKAAEAIKEHELVLSEKRG